MSLPSAKPWGSLSWPNRISIFRLLMVGPFIVLLMNQRQWTGARYVALIIFLAMAVSDLIDGVLARRLNARTRMGAILDPLADKALIICAAVLLSLKDSAVPGAQLPNWIVVAVVGKDLWVIIGFIVVYLVTDRLRVRPTLAGKACTAGQLIMVTCVLASPDFNRLGYQIGTRLATVTIWGVTVLCALAVISYTRLGLSFVAQEDKPLEHSTHDERMPNEPDRPNTR